MAIKITFDANPLTLDKSGVGYFTQEMSQALANTYPTDIQLTGYYFNFAKRKKLIDLPHAPNINYKIIDYMPGKVLSGCRKLGFQFPLNLFVRQPADIVWATNFVPTLVKRDSKLVLAVYDMAFMDCPEYVQSKNLAFLRKWVPKYINRADRIVTNSEFTKLRILEVYGVAKDKIIVMPIPPIKQALADYSILERHALTNGYLLFIGTLEPRKNIVGLVEAYALLPEIIRQGFPLVLAGGKGWHDEQILSRISQLQNKGMNIIQTGYVNAAEKSALYQNATLYIQPSLYEGFGMPLLEAMSYGRAVVCNDITVFHEVAGNNVSYFKKDSTEAMAQTIAIYLSDKNKRAKLEDQAKHYIASYPTWPSIAQAFYTELAKLVNPRA